MALFKVIVYILNCTVLGMKHIHDAVQASPPSSYRMFQHPKRKPWTKSEKAKKG